jgi:cation:H+ antiporter
METLFEVMKLSVSLGVLVFLSDRLIDSGSRLARVFGISPTVIGLTLLAYGTSLPEFSVSSIAAIKGHSRIAVANAIGSNIYNIAVVMGVASLISPFTIKERTLATRDAIIMILSALLLALLSSIGGIGRISGVVMVSLLVFYTIYIIRHGWFPSEVGQYGRVSKAREIALSIVLLSGVLVSGNFTVDSAANLARMIGVGEWVIGATIVAAGTSLPETVVSIIAARKGEFGMSVGNIVGSNIFNILWILGFASILSPLAIDLLAVYPDLIFLGLITILFYIGLSKGRLTKVEGALYIGVYAGYIYCLLWSRG